MARVTVEDCLEHVENRFKLVLLASKRARQLALGTEPLLEWENDKPTVVALREIAENLVNEEMMQASLAAPQLEEEAEFDEDDLAAALHAEISRELSQTAAETPAAEPLTTPEPQVTESPVTETPEQTEPEAPSPMTSSPLFGSAISSNSESDSSGNEFPSEAHHEEGSSLPPSSDESSNEGEQGF